MMLRIKMPLSNFDNLLLPAGIILLAYFLTSANKEKEEEDIFWPGTGDSPYGSVRAGGGLKPVSHWAIPNTMSGSQAGWGHMPGYAVTLASSPKTERQSVFAEMIRNAEQEGGNVSQRLVDEGREVMSSMGKGLKSLQESMALARQKEERKYMDALQSEADEFFKEYGDMDSVAEQYMTILDKRREALSYTLQNPEPVDMFDEEITLNMGERIDMYKTLDLAIGELRVLVKFSCEIFAQSRELLQNFNAPANPFDEEEAEIFSSEGEAFGGGLTSGAIPQSAPTLTAQPSFGSFKPSKSRLSKQDLETTVSQLDFDAPVPKQSFNTIPESPINTRGGGTTLATPSPLKTFAKKYAQRKVGVDGNPDFDASTPSQMYPLPPEIPGSAPPAPPSTPLTAIYESASDYKREAEKMRTIIEASEKAVARAKGDEEMLGEVKRRLQKTQPPEFLKGSWFKAAQGKSSAMQSNGQSMRYGDLMKDQIFNDYQELVRRVNLGLL